MKEWFLHNWQLKALALVLATLTWVFVKGITNDHRTITDIPLEIRVGFPTAGQPAESLVITMRTPGHDEELAPQAG